MAKTSPVVISPQLAVHRIGGGDVSNLRLKPREEALSPPGFSVLLGGSAAEAAEQMREAFPDPVKFGRIHDLTQVVASATVASIVRVGFLVVLDASAKFPNHGRIVHPDGTAGFSDTNLKKLADVFLNTATPRIP